MQQYFPGLQEHIDPGQIATGNRVSGAGQDGESLAPDGGPTIYRLRPMYKTVGHYLDASYTLFKTRMNQELQHISILSTKHTTKTNRNIT